jgi:hypothetical protein
MDNRRKRVLVVAKKQCAFNLPLRVTFVAMQHLAKPKLIENKP